MPVVPHPHTYIRNLGQPSVGFTPKIMVYEDAPVQLPRWEYYVLTIDISERALPDAARLSELGREGWLLNGVLKEESTANASLIHYYFVRQLIQ